MTISDAAAISAIPTATLYRWVKQGRLVAYGKRRQTRINMDEVDQLREIHRPRHLTDK